MNAELAEMPGILLCGLCGLCVQWIFDVQWQNPIKSAADLIPKRPSLTSVRAAAKGCRACDLWTCGTQTVFGEGASRAAVMFVGEQPGNEEDLSGHPFVGPAGKLLDRALADAGITRADAYGTNYQRLQRVKAAYDPDNLFRVNRNIPPAP